MNKELSRRGTLEVVRHHNEALNAGNLEETLLDYGENSFIMTPGGPVEGLAAIREFFRQSIESHLPPETEMTYHMVTAHGKLGYNNRQRPYHK